MRESIGKGLLSVSYPIVSEKKSPFSFPGYRFSLGFPSEFSTESANLRSGFSEVGGGGGA